MPVTLSTSAIEKSTFVITATFKDENGSAVTPTSITWTLTDGDGNVINNRDAVSITPNTSVDIVLSGDDLALTSGSALRILTTEAVYSSSAGTNLPLKDSVSFLVKNLVAVT